MRVRRLTDLGCLQVPPTRTSHCASLWEVRVIRLTDLGFLQEETLYTAMAGTVAGLVSALLAAPVCLYTFEHSVGEKIRR